MEILLYMITILVCVFHVDSREFHRSSVKHVMMMHKRSTSEIGFQEYVYCLDYFMRLFDDNAGTYHGVCHARDKLQICKNRVIEKYPRLEEHLVKGYQVIYEVVADFWCTYNATHHRPADPFYTMDAMYLKYIQCPYAHDFLFTHEDYSPQIILGCQRAAFAGAILKITGSDGLSLWQPYHKYSNPQDLVHKTLSAIWCDAYKRYVYFTDNIMSRYCIIVKHINSDLHDVLDTFNRHTGWGLYNWTTSLCTEYEDALDQAMRLSQLDKWLSHQKKPDLPPCHDHNVYIEGATCLIMFHTTLPPYSDIHNFMQPFVKNTAELNSCWDRVISGCPHASSASRNISLIIEIYNLASDISKEDSSQVWDVIWSWMDLYKKTEQAQMNLQGLYQQLLLDAAPTSSYPLAFSSSLEAALKAKFPLSHNITSLFSKLSSALYNISVVGNDDYHGVNIFEGFSSMNDHVLGLLLHCFLPLYELFLEKGQFVQYMGRCPEWWSLPCE